MRKIEKQKKMNRTQRLTLKEPKLRNKDDSIKFKITKNIRIIKETEDNEKIVEISKIENKTLEKKVQEINDFLENIFGKFRINTSNTKHYLYIKNNSVIGILIAEQIKNGYLVHFDETNQSTPTIAESIQEYTFQKEKALCGISKIYVFEEFRKKGIAKNLVESARMNLIYGFEIPKEEVAFSQPTLDGKIFALKYFKNDDFLIYDV
eukprot:gene7407-11730_t